MAYLIAGIVLLTLGYYKCRLWVWTAAGAALLVVAKVTDPWVWGVAGAIAVVCNVPLLRSWILSWPLMQLFRRLKLMPRISETERVALEAGDVWIERDLFSGRPDVAKLMQSDYPMLNGEEHAFLDGPVEALCKMVREWDVWRDRDFSGEVWSFIKENKFLGMIIPKKYGGLEFTANMHSAVIRKLASRSPALSVTVMVPNSLGPAELLINYGTEEQKNYYLPRLATGEELPCFALTEPQAGSDAGSIQSTGEVFKNNDGELSIRLNWNKRWITLAPIATVIGLAFRLRDPNKLLGEKEDLGITLALVSTNLPGVTHDRRHDPLSVTFYNGPTQGKDVIVPLSAVVGGRERVGQGWKMVVESLGAGRGISLPALCTGVTQFQSYAVGMHSVVRQQFGAPIGNFEGVVEALAPTAGFAYILESARRFTCGALDQGKRPAVITAIMKYYSTELSRTAINHGMDIYGGAGITLGPRNLMARHYFMAPIQITVEGANILTRTLIIFGQGALRAHPFAYPLIRSLEVNDLRAFDASIWALLGNFAQNGIRYFLLGFSRGWIASPGISPQAKYRRKILWASAKFAFLSDALMFMYGGRLKTAERITGRMADVLGWMYLITATMRRFSAEKESQKQNLALVNWSLDFGFAKMNDAFDTVLANVEFPLLGPIIRGPIRILSALNSMGRGPADRLDQKIAQIIRSDSAARSQLLDGMFMPSDPREQELRLETAFILTLRSEPAIAKLKRAIKEKKVPKGHPDAVALQRAVELKILSAEEATLLRAAETARNAAVQVDDFSFDEYLSHDRKQPSGKFVEPSQDAIR